MERKKINISQVKEEASREARQIDRILGKGRVIVEGSNLASPDHPLTGHDITRTRRLLETVAPITKDNARLYSHIQLTAKVARKFGEALKEAQPEEYAELDLNKLEVLGLFQDFGRQVTHRWLRNEIVATNAMRRLGVRSDIVESIPSVSLYVDKDARDVHQIQRTVEEMSPEEKIIEMADLYAKRDPNDPLNIRSFSEVMDFHYASRSKYEKYTGQERLFPSEGKLNRDVVDFSAAVYERLHVWFAKQGVDLDRERQRLLIEESESSIQAVIINGDGEFISNPDSAVSAIIAQLQKRSATGGVDTVITSPYDHISQGSSDVFTLAALRLWLPPQSCVFIDDKRETIEHANASGMTGIQFFSAEQLTKSLQEQGLLNQ